MDNQNRNRRDKRAPVSIDGFVRPGRNLGMPVNRSYQPDSQADSPSMDDYGKQADGFHPSGQRKRDLDASEAKEAAMLDEPIVLDHIEDRKSRQPRFWQRHRSFKKIIKRTSLVFLIIILAGAGYFGYKIYNTQKKVLAGGGHAATVCSDNVNVASLNHEGDARINILLLGIGGPGHDGPDLTDTIMLASIDPINNKVVLISIPRDLWVHIPNDGYQKINAAYAYGKEQSSAKTPVGQEKDGIKLLDKTLANIINVPIHYHVLVDFTAFQQMVDAVGGVTVNVPETLYDPTIAWENHGNPIIAQKGVQHFNGAQALLYSRSRETSSDFARAKRQRLVLVALKQKIFSVGTFSNPIKVSDLLNSLGQNVYTDFDTTSIRCLYHQLSTISSGDVTSLDMVTPPHDILTTGTMDGLSIVEPKAGLFDYKAVQQFFKQSLPDGFILKEHAKVAVYNATNVGGLATSEASILKNYSYDVTTVANAGNATDPRTTTLVDLSKGVDKYTKHYLERRFGVTADSSIPSTYGITPPAGTDFVIILGEDAATSAAQ